MAYEMNVISGTNGTGEKEEEKDAPPRHWMNINWKDLRRKRIPITEWLPDYTLLLFWQDLLAGFTVALTEIPQAIAYAYVAGLQPQYGLYSGIMGCFMYAIFGCSKDVNIGPTAIMALMTQPHVEKLGPDMAVLLSFLAGCIIFLLGLLHLGFLVEFFSYPVISGFTSAAALVIAASQFKSLLGIPGKADAFLDAVISVYNNISKSRKWDTVLGFTTIICLVFMREFKNFGTMRYRADWSKRRNYVGRTLMLLSLSRNALAVLLGTAIAYFLERAGHHPFILTGKVGEGLPRFAPPPFSTTYNNTFYNFGEMVEVYGGSIAFIPLIAVLECVAIAKAFATGKTLDATQEMLALGISNIMGSFVSSMPVTGSFTRTAVNNASGAQTPLGGIVTGTMLLLALAFLTKTFYYIPKATLAAVVICAMFYLFDYHAAVTLWKTKKIELIPFYTTLLACIFLGLEYGILVGLAVNIVFVLYVSARPSIEIEQDLLPQVFLVTPSRSLQYPAAEYIREKIMKECNCSDSTVVINGKYVKSIDTTVAKNFKVLVNDLTTRKQKIVFWNFKRSVIYVCFGIDPTLIRHFQDGALEDVVKEAQQDAASGGLVYTIQ